MNKTATDDHSRAGYPHLFIASFLDIPTWDIFIIPSWYTIVKGAITIKNRLRQLREERKLTQLKVAMDLHLNQNSISRYESGAREAGYELLCGFASYYGVSVDYILCRTDNPKVNL
ncbi:MAG: helix-turn-helix domain-containing protein [bacterium]